MALDKAQLKELKGQLGAARKKDLNFAICLGKQTETTVLLLDRIKAPDALGLRASIQEEKLDKYLAIFTSADSKLSKALDGYRPLDTQKNPRAAMIVVAQQLKHQIDVACDKVATKMTK